MPSCNTHSSPNRICAPSCVGVGGGVAGPSREGQVLLAVNFLRALALHWSQPSRPVQGNAMLWDWFVFCFHFKEWCFHHFFRPGLSHDDSLGFMAGFGRSGTLRGGTPPATPLLPFNLCLEDLPVFLAYESGAFSLCLLVSKVGSRGYKKRSLLLKRKEMWSVTISLQ